MPCMVWILREQVAVFFLFDLGVCVWKGEVEERGGRR